MTKRSLFKIESIVENDDDNGTLGTNTLQSARFPTVLTTD